MKHLFLLALFLIPVLAFGQKDTVYCFGVNGKVNDVVKEDIKKVVDYRGKKKIRVKTYKNTETGWLPVYTEKLKVLNDSACQIKMKSDEFSGKFTRTYKPTVGGYSFTERLSNNVVKRTGITKQKIPLILEGSITENYNSGKIKSVAVYKNNELVSNKNWLPDGAQLPDDIFYAVDSEPSFVPGMPFMHQQIRKAIFDSKFDLETVEGQMMMGLVISKEGKIAGIQVVKGISQTLNGILADSFGKVEGAWVPAKLNGKPVNYFQLIPINFIYNKYKFDYLEMDLGMMYWMIN